MQGCGRSGQLRQLAYQLIWKCHLSQELLPGLLEPARAVERLRPLSWRDQWAVVGLRPPCHWLLLPPEAGSSGQILGNWTDSGKLSFIYQQDYSSKCKLDGVDFLLKDNSPFSWYFFSIWLVVTF